MLSRSLKRFWLGTLALWLILLPLFYAWVVISSRLAHHVPEIGYFGAFVFFGAIYSAAYWVAALLLGGMARHFCIPAAQQAG